MKDLTSIPLVVHDILKDQSHENGQQVGQNYLIKRDGVIFSVKQAVEKEKFQQR